VVFWRVSNHATLDGIGGMLASGRWHSRGRPVLYCTLNPATALLETLVHMEIDPDRSPKRFQILRIAGPDVLHLEHVNQATLPANWNADIEATQAIGDRWLVSSRSLLLQVPSVLVPETWNILVNPAHPDARLLKIDRIYQYPYDSRLL
jgi:RES domain-containing protein